MKEVKENNNRLRNVKNCSIQQHNLSKSIASAFFELKQTFYYFIICFFLCKMTTKQQDKTILTP